MISIGMAQANERQLLLEPNLSLLSDAATNKLGSLHFNYFKVSANTHTHTHTAVKLPDCI